MRASVIPATRGDAKTAKQLRALLDDAEQELTVVADDDDLTSTEFSEWFGFVVPWMQQLPRDPPQPRRPDWLHEALLLCIDFDEKLRCRHCVAVPRMLILVCNVCGQRAELSISIRRFTFSISSGLTTRGSIAHSRFLLLIRPRIRIPATAEDPPRRCATTRFATAMRPASRAEAAAAPLRARSTRRRHSRRRRNDAAPCSKRSRYAQ